MTTLRAINALSTNVPIAVASRHPAEVFASTSGDHFSHVAVVESEVDGKLVGLLAISDLVKGAEGDKRVVLRDLIRGRPVIHVKPETLLHDVQLQLAEIGQDAAAVVNDTGTYLGTVTIHNIERRKAEAQTSHAELTSRLERFSMKHAAEPMFWVGSNAEIVYANQAACHVLGYSQEELTAKFIFEIDPTYTPLRFAAAWTDFRKRGKTTTVETRHVTKAGKLLDVEVTSNLIVHEGREYNCAIARDITERKQLEQSLRLTQFSMDRAADPIFWIAPNAEILYVNDAACRVLGFDRDEMVGKTVADIDPNFPMEAWPAHWEEIKTRRSFTFESDHATKSGRILKTEVTVNYIQHEGREFNCAMMRDVTLRTQTEQRLRDSEQRLERVLANIHDAVIVDDVDGRLVYANRRFFQLFGIPEQDPQKIVLESYVPPEWREILRDRHNRRVRGESAPGQYEYQGMRADGTRMWLEVRVVPVVENGRITGTQSALRDITERKLAEIVAENSVGAIHASERRLRQLIDACFGLITLLDLDGNVVEVNQTSLQLGCLTRDQVVGRPFWETYWWPFAPDSQAMLQGIIRRAASGETVRCELVAQVGQTGMIVTDSTFGPLRDSAGRVSGIIGFGVDISERKRAEANLIASEARFRTIFESDPECIKLVDRNGSLLDMNPAGLNMIEAHSIDDVRGANAPDLVLPEYRKQYRKDIEAVFATGGPIVRKFEIKGLRGTCRWLEQHAVGLRDPNDRDRIVQMLAVARDITAHKRDSEMLSRSERNYRGLFENAHDAIIIFRAEDEVVLDANHRACEMYGFSPQEFIGMALTRVSSDEELGRQQITETMRRGSKLNFESLQYRKDGSEMPVEINAAVIEYNGERAILSINRDVSWRKQAEARLIKAERREAMATLTAGIAHEFNSSLLAAASFLHSSTVQTDPSITKAIAIIQQAQGLSASLLELFAGPESSKPPILAIGKWLPECAQNISEGLPVGNHVTPEPIDRNLEVYADPLALEQVLRILVTNATDALSGPGEIRVLAAQMIESKDFATGNKVEIRVSDEGPGIDEENRNRVFEPFFTTRKRARRSGMGLAIASRLVEQQGGTLTYEPNVGRGSVFVIRLRGAIHDNLKGVSQ